MKIADWGKKAVSVAGYLAVNAITWLLLLSIIGGVLLVAGVYALLGAGFSYLVAGALLIAAAGQIKKGMTSG